MSRHHTKEKEKEHLPHHSASTQSNGHHNLPTKEREKEKEKENQHHGTTNNNSAHTTSSSSSLANTQKTVSTSQKAQHKFVKTKFNRSVVCKVCNKTIRGLTNVGFSCAVCAMAIHKSCAVKGRQGNCREASLASNFVPFKPVIRETCLSNMQRLLYLSQEHQFDLPKKLKPTAKDVIAAKFEDFNAELAVKIEKLWSTKVLRDLYVENWQTWQITENADYFFDQVMRLASPDFLPNTQDILRAKIKEQGQKAHSYKDRVFRVWLPRGERVEVPYNGDAFLKEVLVQVRSKDKDNDWASHVAWDTTGKKLTDYDVCLSTLNSLEIYFLPEGQQPQVMKASQQEKKRRRLSATTAQLATNGGRSWSIKNLSPRGSVRLSQKFDFTAMEKRNGTMSLTIGEAHDLANENAFFEFLYVVVYEVNGEKRHRSGLCENSPKPNWEHTFKFNAQFSYCEFMITVWATNKNGRVADVMLGQCSVVLAGFGDGDQSTEEHKLRKENKKYKTNRKHPGILTVTWAYHDKKKKMPKPKEEGEASESKSRNEKQKKNFAEYYDLKKKLGEGAFSVVKAAHRKSDGKQVAVKILENFSNLEDADEDVYRFQRERDIMANLDHENIVKMFELFEDQDHYYMVLELVSGGELFEQIVEKGCFEEQECARLILQVLNALSYLDEHHVCHRDLKPENLMFTDDTYTTLKLIDFGEARSCAEGKIKEYVGTTDYMAPEVIKGGDYDTRVDMWSLGVMVYVMLCGFPPWEGETDTDVFVNIMKRQYEFVSPEWDHISDDAKDFVRALLQEHDVRLTAKQARQHKWIKKYKPNPTMSLTLELPSDTFDDALLNKLIRVLEKNVGAVKDDVEVEETGGQKVAKVSFFPKKSTESNEDES